MHGTKCQIELNERTNESGHSSICSYRICKYGKRLQIVIPGMECPECFWFHMRMMMGEHNKTKWQKCFLICILKLQECGKKSQPQNTAQHWQRKCQTDFTFTWKNINSSKLRFVIESLFSCCQCRHFHKIFKAF